MLARLRSWWQKAKKPVEVFAVFVGCLMTIALLVVIVRAYIFHVNVPSISDKHLWDWLQLLIIPAVLAVGGYVFTYTTSRNDRAATEKRTQTERDISSDNQRETALQSYIDKISELLLDKQLRESQSQDEVRTIARVRTLTTLTRLDKVRKGSVIQFLYESQLISKDNSIINLEGADLSDANLSFADLSDANLREANLSAAKLSYANLSFTDLSDANLSGADLSFANLSRANLGEANLSDANLYRANLGEANLSGADLSDADLSGATVSNQQLDGTLALWNATMPDGSKHSRFVRVSLT